MTHMFGPEGDRLPATCWRSSPACFGTKAGPCRSAQFPAERDGGDRAEIELVDVT